MMCRRTKEGKNCIDFILGEPIKEFRGMCFYLKGKLLTMVELEQRMNVPLSDVKKHSMTGMLTTFIC